MALPTGPPADQHRAGHEPTRSLPRGRRPASRQRGSRAVAPPVGGEQDQPSPHRPDRRRRPFVFGPRLRWAASGSRACTLAVVIMHITGAMVGPFGACSGLATRTGREKPALFFLAVAAPLLRDGVTSRQAVVISPPLLISPRYQDDGVRPGWRSHGNVTSAGSDITACSHLPERDVVVISPRRPW